MLSRLLPRRFSPRLVPLTLLLLALPTLLYGWGVWSHPRINRAAVLALPLGGEDNYL